MSEQTKDQMAPEMEQETPETVEGVAAENVEELSPFQALEAERDEWKDKSYRLAAEMENMKKRTFKEVSEARKYSASNFARELLAVQDNMERALAVMEEQSVDKTVLDGVNMVKDQLEKAFASAKVAKFTSVGEKLDPSKHQAVVEIPTNDFEPGIVAQEVQCGYMIDDRLLRPAMVGVAKKAE